MNPDSLENRLRDALLRSTTELNNYKQLYRESQKENASLRKIAKDLETQNKCLNQTNLNLYQRSSIKNDLIQQLEKKVQKVKVPKIRKKIGDIKSRSQISRRKKVYKKFIARTIKNIPDAVSANVSIDLGSEWMNIQFSQSDLNQSENTAQDTLNAQNVANDHPYSSVNVDADDDDDDDDDDDGEESADSEVEPVFVANGKISQRHKRCVAHVMDYHKISERAYHELRLSCKGVLPPLSNVRKERLLMSAEIPYVVNPTVSNFWYIKFKPYQSSYTSSLISL